MLQRVQTIYLFSIVVLSCITLFLPVAGLINKEEALLYLVNFQGIYLVQSTGNTFQSSVWGLSAIASIIPIISLITIFLFKNRTLQVRLSFFNLVLMAGYYVLLYIYLWFAGKQFHAEWYLQVIAALPLVNIILNFLAIRAIAKDEALVKSMNRLR